MLLGLLEPTLGRAEVLGFDTRAHSTSIRERTGALLEHDGLYECFSAEDNLDFLGRIYRLSKADRQARIHELLINLIRQGQLLAVGTPDELRARTGEPQAEIIGRGFTAELLAQLRQRPEITKVLSTQSFDDRAAAGDRRHRVSDQCLGEQRRADRGSA